jgi:hypothetical protein
MRNHYVDWLINNVVVSFHSRTLIGNDIRAARQLSVRRLYSFLMPSMKAVIGVQALPRFPPPLDAAGAEQGSGANDCLVSKFSVPGQGREGLESAQFRHPDASRRRTAVHPWRPFAQLAATRLSPSTPSQMSHA